MLWFCILLLVPMAIQHIAVPRIRYERKNRAALVFFFLLMFVMVAFRHDRIGNDTSNYIEIYYRLSQTPYSSLKAMGDEPLFTVFCKLCSYVSSDYRFFFAISALIPIWGIGRLYCRESEDASLTIILFAISSVFVMLFSGIRQSIAIGIGMIAFTFVRKKQFWRFLICVILAMGFHNSAALLLLLYPAYHVKITKKWLYGVVPVMIAIFVFNRQIFSFLLTILSQYSRFEGEISSTGAYTMLILFAMLGAFSFVIPEEKKLDADAIGLRNILLLVIVLQMFAPLHTLAMRMNYYFIPFVPALIPRIIRCRKTEMAQVAILARHIMVIVFAIYFFAFLIPSNPLHIYPYHFFWENYQ